MLMILYSFVRTVPDICPEIKLFIPVVPIHL